MPQESVISTSNPVLSSRAGQHSTRGGLCDGDSALLVREVRRYPRRPVDMRVGSEQLLDDRE